MAVPIDYTMGMGLRGQPMAGGLQAAVQRAPMPTGAAPTAGPRPAPMPTTMMPTSPRPTAGGILQPQGNPQTGSAQNVQDAQQQMDFFRKMLSPNGNGSLTDQEMQMIAPDAYRGLQGGIQSAANQYIGTPYGFSQGANWARPGGDPNAGWVSGQNAPMAGVDQRIADNIYNPNAYQYGGQPGMAQQEANRFGGMANDARAAGIGAQMQYQQGIGLSDQARAQQMQGLGYLQNMAQGNGPSAAQIQANQGLAAARAQQASIAAGARGGGAGIAAAQQAAANAAGGLSANAVQSNALLRANEQMNAMQQYGQQAGALRSGDYQRAQMAAGQQQFAGQQQSDFERMRQQVYQQQQGYQQAAEQQNLAREAAQRGWNLSQQQMSQANQNSWLNAGISAGSAALMAAAVMSDERAKEDVTDGDDDVDEALSKLRPRSFKYKKGLGDTPNALTGVMAQHLAASKAGSALVEKGDDGYLRVKVPHAAMLALASAARLHRRVEELEKRNARK